MANPLDFILENMRQGVAIFDADLHLTMFNDRLKELLPAPEDTICLGASAATIAAAIPSLNSSPHLSADNQENWLTHLLRQSTPLHLEVATGDLKVSVTSVPTPGGGWLIMCDDISGRIGMEKALAEQNHRLDAALGNMPHGLCMFDADKNLLLCNAAYSRLYDLPRHLTLPGTPLEQILSHRKIAGNAPTHIGMYFDVVVEAALKGSIASQKVSLTDGRVIKITHKPMENGCYVATHEDVTVAIRAEEQIKHMAGHDPLTGLPNRSLLREKIDRRIALGGTESGIALFILDLDHFNEINDAFGHAAGDLLLKAVTERLKESLRNGEAITRLGGDEFVVLLECGPAGEKASLLAQTIVDDIGRPFEIDGRLVQIGVSIGVATVDDGDTANALLRHANTALHNAKSGGRGTYRVFDPAMDTTIQRRRKLEADLMQALANKQFEIDYQPQVDTRSEEIVCFEALLRWNRSEQGSVAPAEFIPLAEESGLIVPIGEWVLRQACKDAVNWPPHIRVAVNLSPLQCRSQTLAHSVVSALTDSGLPASRLELEITESVLLTDSEAALVTLHHIKSLGVRIAMDDFGIGYSSLNYLRLFPFDKIKIDKSFIRELGHSKDCAAIVKAVVDLGAGLGITTTAEGVETREQLLRVREQGCTEIQGYLFGRPQPLAEVRKLLQRCSPAALQPTAR
ncbi:EAL domain-containing protein [Neorhizobium sp. P12A]|uniref:EAL domain-containing protein n=1 Tax=Neorhizobium sp. P12A TaxID=2268027 RepID=UPI0011EFEBD7|nr:EAL domain-containing protein [Neorhizobium sp. P12A]KAA0693313.1 EAL domain-containing protein [Neorhizobium sp. P12A]